MLYTSLHAKMMTTGKRGRLQNTNPCNVIQLVFGCVIAPFSSFYVFLQGLAFPELLHGLHAVVIDELDHAVA